MPLLLFVIHSLALLTMLVTGLGYLSPLYWPFSFLEHARPLYALTLLIALLVQFVPFAPGVRLAQPTGVSLALVILGAIALFLNLVLLFPFLPTPFSAAPTAPNNLRLLHATLNFRNPQTLYDAVTWIDRQDLDLIFLLEIPPDAAPALKQFQRYDLVTLNTTTPNDPTYQPPSNHAQALLLPKQPQRDLQLTGTHVLNLPADNRRPLLAADFTFQGKPLTIVDFHAVRPRLSPQVGQFQQLELTALADWSTTQETQAHSTVLIGDWNTTPWSHLYRTAIRRSGLIDSMQHRGIQASWSAFWPVFLRIPIDHCWHSPQLRTVYRAAGPKLGSDHLPLRVDLEWRSPDSSVS